MHVNEPGVLPGSDRYAFNIPEDLRSLHYYIAFCGHFTCTFGYQIKRPYYEHLLLAYVHAGEFHITYNQQKQIARAGDMVILDCQSPHHYYSGANLIFTWFHVDGCNAHELCADINKRHGILFSHHHKDLVKDKMFHLISNFRNNQPLAAPIISDDIHSIICHMYPDANPSGSFEKKEESVALVIEYLKNHLSDPVTVEDMSSIANLSRYHFSRTFKKSTGLSPYQYLLNMRFDYAKHLLKTTGLSVGEIAGRTGFQSEIAFITAFSEKIGLPPGQYRKFLIPC